MTAEEQKQLQACTDGLKKCKETIENQKKEFTDGLKNVEKTINDSQEGISNNLKKIEGKIDRMHKYWIKFPHCSVTIALGVCFILSGIGVAISVCNDKTDGTYSFAAMSIVCLIGLIVANCYYIYYTCNNRNE